MPEIEPLVSVVVPTYNSSSTLEACLKSVRAQTYSNIEMVVVDNYSTDVTVMIAKKYGSIIFQVEALRSAARNYGAKKAKGFFFLFVDADMELTPKVIEECVNKTMESNAAAIMIPEIRVGIGFWANCRAIERLTYIGDPLIESARFFSRKVFEKVGGYDGYLEAGEDWDLHARVQGANYKITNITAVIKHKEGYVTLKEIVRKKYHYGRTLMKYVKKHPKMAMIQFMPIRLNYLRHIRLLAKEPLYGCGMLFMKMVEYMTAAISIFLHLNQNDEV